MNPIRSVTLLVGLIICLTTLKVDANDSLFYARADYPLIGDANMMCASDFDGDGDRDLAVTSIGFCGVIVALNDGNGRFDSCGFYDSGCRPWGVVAVDVDGDLDQDLVVSNSEESNLVVLKNDGTGHFDTKVYYSVGEPTRSIVAADFDGDGDQDIAIGHVNSDFITTLENIGDGVFAVAIPHAVYAYVDGAVVAADFNGDASIDLAVSGGGLGGFSLLFNNGDGTFGAPVFTQTTNETLLYLAATDADLDGDIDLVASTCLHVDVFRNDGTGLLVTGEHLQINCEPWCLGGITTGDLNGDGYEDVAVAAGQWVATLLNTRGITYRVGCLYPTGGGDDVGCHQGRRFRWRPGPGYW